MSEGWICPKCGRALAPWVSVCPCYLDGAELAVSNGGTVCGNISTGKCSRVCSNKDDWGYCRTTVCIRPEFGLDQNYGTGNGA